jgi:ketosteroid isomerase-like protein
MFHVRQALFTLVLGASAVTSGCATSTPQGSPAPAFSNAVAAYGAAWASRDVERILALHTDDTEFTLFVDGVETARGRDAVRRQFAWVFETNPTYAGRTVAVHMTADSATIEYLIAMAPQNPFTPGRWRFTPTGDAYDVRAIDMLYFRDGLVRALHIYLDAEATRANSAAVAALP